MPAAVESALVYDPRGAVAWTTAAIGTRNMNLRPLGSSSRRVMTVTLVLGVALAAAFAPADAKPKSRTVERSWVHPEFARFGIHRIAILPAVTFNGDDQASNATAAVWF